jgi:hypothetical protein
MVEYKLRPAYTAIKDKTGKPSGRATLINLRPIIVGLRRELISLDLFKNLFECGQKPTGS